MRKNYQTAAAVAATDDSIVVPEAVAVTMAELTGALQEGLLALAVGAGLQVMQAVMEENVTELTGLRGRHDPGRRAVRHGSGEGSVTLGGRRVPVRRPRVRAADGSGELAVPAYELFASTELLGQLALERMMAKLSTRRYSAGLEPVGSAVEQPPLALGRALPRRPRCPPSAATRPHLTRTPRQAPARPTPAPTTRSPHRTPTPYAITPRHPCRRPTPTPHVNQPPLTTTRRWIQAEPFRR